MKMEKNGSLQCVVVHSPTILPHLHKWLEFGGMLSAFLHPRFWVKENSLIHLKS